MTVEAIMRGRAEGNLLILLTNYYPFQKGEEYIENEITYLANEFDKVLVIATMTDKDDVATRAVPDNVKAYSAGVAHSKAGRGKMILKNISRAERNRRRNSAKGEFSNPAHKLYATYFEARFLEVYPSVTAILDKEGVKAFEKIVIYSYWLYMTARLALGLKKHYFRSRHVFTFSRAHRYDVDEEAAPLGFLPYRPYLLKHLDAVYPVTTSQVRALTEKYPQAPGKVELRTLGTLGQGGGEIPPGKVPLFVSCSGIRKVKRIDVIVKALAELQSKRPELPFQWLHFGDGPQADAMKNLAKETLHPDHFQFKGHISNQDLHLWYQRNRVRAFLNASSSEGVPVSIMEAASYGIPVIATDVGGTGDIVKNQENGYLLPADLKPQDLARALEDILTMEEGKYQEWSEASFSIWDDSYNAEKVYAAFAQEISTRQD